MIKALERTTTASRAAETLRRAILTGELAAGEVLRQEDLAARLGISRIPLREALRQLEGEGFVTSSPHRGVVVAGIAVDEVQEVSQIRALLECELLRLAGPAHTRASLAHAREILQHIDDDASGFDHWGERNWEFHSALYEPAARPRILALAAQYHMQTERYLRLHLSLLNYKSTGQKEHYRMLDLIAKKKFDAAVGLLHKHIMDVASMIGDVLHRERTIGKG